MSDRQHTAPRCDRQPGQQWAQTAPANLTGHTTAAPIAGMPAKHTAISTKTTTYAHTPSCPVDEAAAIVCTMDP